MIIRTFNLNTKNYNPLSVEDTIVIELTNGKILYISEIVGGLRINAVDGELSINPENTNTIELLVRES